MESPTVAAVVLGGGGGTRFGGVHNKIYLPLAGRRVVSWSLLSMARVPEIGRIILTVRPEERELAAEIIDRELPNVAVSIIEGGNTRHGSEHNALQYLAPTLLGDEVDVVLLHDAARPLVGPSLIRRVIDAARSFGGAIPSLPVDDVVEVDAHDHIRDRFSGSTLIRVQTPQAFRATPLLAAYRAADVAGFIGNDTAACIERFSDTPIRHVVGDPRNIKLTYPQDLFIAERILAASGYSLK